MLKIKSTRYAIMYLKSSVIHMFYIEMWFFLSDKNFAPVSLMFFCSKDGPCGGVFLSTNRYKCRKTNPNIQEMPTLKISCTNKMFQTNLTATASLKIR